MYGETVKYIIMVLSHTKTLFSNKGFVVYARGTQTFQTPRSHRKTLGVAMILWGTFHTENPQI